MTREQARADIYRQLIAYLNINPIGYVVFNEELNGNHYAVTFISMDSKHCILASCDNIADPTATALIIQY